MKKIIIENKYATSLLDFLNNELLKHPNELEGVISLGDEVLNDNNVFLYECFQALNKKYTTQEIEKNFPLWFPYGILISPYDFSYEVVKKYVVYLSKVYNVDEKDLFFHPASFFQLQSQPELIEKIKQYFDNYKQNHNVIYQIKEQLENNKQISVNIDEKKFLKSKMIVNVTEKNKHFLEFLIEEDVYSGNSTIEYAGKEILLLEYLLLRSLSASKEIIKKLMLTVNKKNLMQIKNNIEKINLSYLNKFQEEFENFQENMHLLDKKMLLLKFEEEDKGSSGSGSSSKGVVKI